ncbi:MAG: hypothetical protein WD649_01515 [Thermoleophilaceae bacterium]
MAVTALLAVSAAMFGGVTSAHATLPGRTGNIAVGLDYSDRGGVNNRRIVVLNRRGKELRTLGRCERNEFDPPVGRCPFTPAYSADGSRVAFGSVGTDDVSRLAVAGADGSSLRLLPRLTRNDTEPAWSPGGLIVFTGVTNGKKNLFIVKPDGTGLRQLTFAGGRTAAWSVRNRIAFVRAGRLYTLNPDGTKRVRLRRGDEPDFSPSGKRIIYERTVRDNAGFDITRLYILSSLHRFRRFTRRNGSEPSWSPAGWTIAFVRFFEELNGLFTVGLNRRGLRELIAGELGSINLEVSDPAWQPLP